MSIEDTDLKVIHAIADLDIITTGSSYLAHRWQGAYIAIARSRVQAKFDKRLVQEMRRIHVRYCTDRKKARHKLIEDHNFYVGAARNLLAAKEE